MDLSAPYHCLSSNWPRGDVLIIMWKAIFWVLFSPDWAVHQVPNTVLIFLQNWSNKDNVLHSSCQLNLRLQSKVMSNQKLKLSVLAAMVFFGALLLFGMEPLIGRLLTLFWGSAHVWLTASCSFRQCFLLVTSMLTSLPEESVRGIWYYWHFH